MCVFGHRHDGRATSLWPCLEGLGCSVSCPFQVVMRCCPPGGGPAQCVECGRPFKTPPAVGAPPRSGEVGKGQGIGGSKGKDARKAWAKGKAGDKGKTKDQGKNKGRGKGPGSWPAWRGTGYSAFYKGPTALALGMAPWQKGIGWGKGGPRQGKK